MRLPNHIALDQESLLNVNSGYYWALHFLELQATHPQFLLALNLNKNYITKRVHSRSWLKKSKLLSNAKINTLKFSDIHYGVTLDKKLKKSIPKLLDKELFNIDDDVKTQLLGYSRVSTKDVYMYLNLGIYKYSQRNLRGVFLREWTSSPQRKNYLVVGETSANPLNINFLRRERLYTKLKYSRTPAYDIVSGGSAAILAGFIGFLVSEKFGFELVDSGDFYFLFMYMVFVGLAIRPLLVVANPNKGFIDLVTLWRIYDFYSLMLVLLLAKFYKK